MRRRISQEFNLEQASQFRSTGQFRRAKASHDDARFRCEYERNLIKCRS